MYILIVDDASDIRLILTVALTDAGYRVECVTNGQEALARLRTATERPGLILLDLMMPIMDGWEFLRRQQADPALAAIPVVVLSAVAEAAAGAALGARRVLRKPIDFAALRAVVAQYCTADL